MSKRETIIQAFLAKAAAVSGVGGRVFRSREDAIATTESPSVVVRPESEDVQEMTNGLVECFLQITVDVFQRGAGLDSAPDQLADAVLQELHGLLLADPQLGGLAIDLVDLSTTFDFDSGDETAAMITTRYRVWYRRARAYMA